MAEAAPSEAAPAAAPPSDAELDTGPGFKLESHWAIVHKMDTWYPDVVTRSGDNFIKLSKFDRHFVKFCLQKPMDLSKGVGRSANSTLFDKLLELAREPVRKVLGSRWRCRNLEGTPHLQCPSARPTCPSGARVLGGPSCDNPAS